MLNGLIWNVRGMGNKSSQRRIKFMKDSNPLFFLAILEPMHVLDHGWANKKFGFSSVIANVNNKIWFYSVDELGTTVIIDHDQFIHLRFRPGCFRMIFFSLLSMPNAIGSFVEICGKVFWSVNREMVVHGLLAEILTSLQIRWIILLELLITLEVCMNFQSS